MPSRTRKKTTALREDKKQRPSFVIIQPMPKLPPAGAVIGMQVTGDIAGVTYVQNKQMRRVAYAKTYPKKTPSHLQEYRRTRFKAAVDAWRSQPAGNKYSLDIICEKYKMCMSGYNLFISCYLTGQDTWIPTWCRDLDLPWVEV